MAEAGQGDDAVLSINAAARIAGVSRAALYKAIDRGALEPTGSQPANVTRAALQQWLDSRSSTDPSSPTRLRAVDDDSRDSDAPSREDAPPGVVSPSAIQPPDSVAWSIVASQQDTIAAQNRIISEQLRVLAEQSATIATMVDDLLQRAR